MIAPSTVKPRALAYDRSTGLAGSVAGASSTSGDQWITVDASGTAAEVSPVRAAMSGASVWASGCRAVEAAWSVTGATGSAVSRFVSGTAVSRFASGSAVSRFASGSEVSTPLTGSASPTASPKVAGG